MKEKEIGPFLLLPCEMDFQKYPLLPNGLLKTNHGNEEQQLMQQLM